MRIGILIAALVSLTACTTLPTPTFTTDDGAIRGYDPVAYHTEGQPVKGDRSLTTTFNDANWYFSTAENLELFRDNPQRYAPQYGGFCAYAMSKGNVASTDPDAWTIVDGKLYLNYSLGVRRTWLKDVAGNIEKADMHWQQKIADADF